MAAVDHAHRLRVDSSNVLLVSVKKRRGLSCGGEPTCACVPAPKPRGQPGYTIKRPHGGTSLGEAAKGLRPCARSANSGRSRTTRGPRNGASTLAAPGGKAVIGALWLSFALLAHACPTDLLQCFLAKAHDVHCAQPPGTLCEVTGVAR